MLFFSFFRLEFDTSEDSLKERWRYLQQCRSSLSIFAVWGEKTNDIHPELTIDQSDLNVDEHLRRVMLIWLWFEFGEVLFVRWVDTVRSIESIRETEFTVTMTSIARLVSETATCLGTGILGLSYVLIKGNGIKIMKYLTFSSIGAGVLYSLIQRNRQKTVHERNVILITGCDSGLG